MQPFLHYSKTNAGYNHSSFYSKSVRRHKYFLMLLLPFFAILAQAPFIAVEGQTITITNVTPKTICANTDETPIAIVFSATGFTTGNVFTAELSDATGSFTTPTVIGTRTSTTGPVLIGSVPSVPAGTAYQIRIRASNPVATSNNFGGIT